MLQTNPALIHGMSSLLKNPVGYKIKYYLYNFVVGIMLVCLQQTKKSPN